MVERFHIYSSDRSSTSTLIFLVAFRCTFILITTLLGHRNTETTKKLDFKSSHLTSVGGTACAEAGASRPTEGFCHATLRLSRFYLLPPYRPPISLCAGTAPRPVGGAWRPRRDVTPAAQSAPTRRATTTKKTDTLPGRYRSLVSLKYSSPAPTTSLAYKAPVLSPFRSNELVYPPI